MTVKGRKRDAERELARLLADCDRGITPVSGKLTVGRFLREWLQGYVELNVRPKTAAGYRSIVETRLIPAFGRLQLAKLEPRHISAYYADAVREGRLDGRHGGISARTVTNVHRVLSEALGHGVTWGLIVRNPAIAVHRPRPARREMRTLDAQGVHRLLATAQDTDIYPVVHLAVFTGLRRSELLGLRWSDIDLDFATLRVVWAMHKIKPGQFIFEPPKSSKGRRAVSLSPAAVFELRGRQRRQQANADAIGLAPLPESPVFARPDGSPMLPDSVSHTVSKVAERAGLKLAQGVHPKIVSERLGHSTISVTLDTYSHVVPGLQEAAAARFEEGLFGSRVTLVKDSTWELANITRQQTVSRRRDPPPARATLRGGFQFEMLEPLAGIEPATHGLGNRCSIL